MFQLHLSLQLPLDNQHSPLPEVHLLVSMFIMQVITLAAVLIPHQHIVSIDHAPYIN